jgi:transcriptional regulator
MSLHIGKEIEQRYRESGIKLSEFAKRLNTSPRNVYAIFERSDIKTDLLLKVSEILKFNFFSLYKKGEAVQEPEVQYESKRSDGISIIVNLDGRETTLNQLIKKLTAINRSLS